MPPPSPATTRYGRGVFFDPSRFRFPRSTPPGHRACTEPLINDGRPAKVIVAHRSSSRKTRGRFGRHPLGSDTAVSPVVSEILMVAIAVVLAAGGYLWFSSLTDDGPGDLERVAFSVDRAGSGTSSEATWAKVVLIHDDQGERAFERMFISWQASDGSVLYKDSGEGILCTVAQAQILGGDAFCAAGADVIGDTSTTHWTVGQTYYMPCQDRGPHAVTISVDQQTVLDTRVLCDKAAG